MTTCEYCGHDNPEPEHRCQRCGRRLSGANVFPVPNPYPHSRTATAPQLAREPKSLSHAGIRRTPPMRPVQKPLFTGPVIRFEDIDVSQRKPVKRRSPRRPPKPPAMEQQQKLDFTAALPVAASGVESVLYTEQKVAGSLHRSVAVVVDAAMVALAAAPFLFIVYQWGGGLGIDPLSLSAQAGALLLIHCLYRLLWCLSGTDTPGMRWTGLRLVNFDGHPPTQRQRVCRMAAVYLSVGAMGLGLLWALGDQEKLTWHDHISKTFPSPRM